MESPRKREVFTWRWSVTPVSVRDKRWSLTILLTKSSRTASCCSTDKNGRTHVLTLPSIAMTSPKQSDCFVDRTIPPGRPVVLMEQAAWTSAVGSDLFSFLEVQASQFVKRQMIPSCGNQRIIKPAWGQTCIFPRPPFSSKLSGMLKSAMTTKVSIRFNKTASSALPTKASHQLSALTTFGARARREHLRLW